jgi:hypothetical protein
MFYSTYIEIPNVRSLKEYTVLRVGYLLFIIIIISSGSAAQRGLWPPLALQPSAGYGLLWLCSPARAMASSFTRFLDHTKRRATVGRAPLDE